MSQCRAFGAFQMLRNPTVRRWALREREGECVCECVREREKKKEREVQADTSMASASALTCFDRLLSLSCDP